MNTSDVNTPISRLVADASLARRSAGDCCHVVRLPLQDGVELLHWYGHFEEPLDIRLSDDTDRISFSFNFGLDGAAECEFEGRLSPCRYAVRTGMGNIIYGPGRQGRYRQHGTLENFSVMVRPDILSTWEPHLDAEMRCLLTVGGITTGHRSAELSATAQRLNRALLESQRALVRHSLWLQGQAITLVALFLEIRGQNCGGHVSPSSRFRLGRARDQLLSDLAHAPSLAQLAADAGMSEPTLIRGFRRLFGMSPYAIFQRERMHAARLRLQLEQASVGVVATDLGYTNISHFAAAFRREFGMTPREFRESRVLF